MLIEMNTYISCRNSSSANIKFTSSDVLEHDKS